MMNVNASVLDPRLTVRYRTRSYDTPERSIGKSRGRGTLYGESCRIYVHVTFISSRTHLRMCKFHTRPEITQCGSNMHARKQLSSGPRLIPINRPSTEQHVAPNRLRQLSKQVCIVWHAIRKAVAGNMHLAASCEHYTRKRHAGSVNWPSVQPLHAPIQQKVTCILKRVKFFFHYIFY